MPAVCGIAKRAEIRVMWGDDHNPPTRRSQSMKLLQRLNYIGYMLDDVDGANFSKRCVPKRKGKAIYISYNVRPGIWVAVDAYRARVLLNAATDIKYRELGSEIVRSLGGLRRRAYAYRACRHSSNVSMAKSACSRVITSGGHNRMLFGPAPKVNKPRSNAIISRRSRSAGARSFVFWS